MKDIKIHINYSAFRRSIVEFMPEFEYYTGYDEHRNTEFERNCRLLNQWKAIKINEFAKKYSKGRKVLSIPATSLFLLKLELAEYTYKINNPGKMTHQQAIDFVKNL